MINKVKSLAQNTIVTGTLIVTIGTFIGSIFGYVLQVSLGRLLSVEDYGVFNALLSLAVILTVPSLALSNSLIKIVSELKAQDKFDVLTQLYVKVTLFILVFGTIVSFLIYLLRFQIANYLNIADALPVIFFGIFLGLSFLSINPSSYLQGLLRFKAFAFFAAISGFLRTFLALTFVVLGFNVGGVYFGLGLSFILLYIIATFLLKKNFTKFESISLRSYYKNIANLGIVMFFVGVGMTFLNNVDVILVKHFFDATTAGLYSGVVTVGKIFLFGAGTVTILMYPQIAELYTKGENYIKRFLQFLTVQLVLIFGGIIVFSLFPKLITQTLFSDQFLLAVPYIPKFSIFVAFYILINFMYMFLLAINKKIIWIFLFPTIALQYLLINAHHLSLNSVINTNILVSGGLLFVIVAYTLYNLKNVSFSNNSSL